MGGELRTINGGLTFGSILGVGFFFVGGEDPKVDWGLFSNSTFASIVSLNVHLVGDLSRILMFWGDCLLAVMEGGYGSGNMLIFVLLGEGTVLCILICGGH